MTSMLRAVAAWPARRRQISVVALTNCCERRIVCSAAQMQPHSTSRAFSAIVESTAVVATAPVALTRTTTASGGRGYRIPAPPRRGTAPAADGEAEPTRDDGEVFPSVTTVLNVMDKGGLVTWAVRTCMGALRTSLHDALAAELRTIQSPLSDGAAAQLLQRVKFDELVAAASRASDAVKSAAADVGTRAHACIDAFIVGRGVVFADGSVEGRAAGAVDPALHVDADIEPVVRGFMRWYGSAGIRLSATGDTSVYSRSYGYAGSLDCVGRTSDGAYVVVDFKTSNSVHNSYALQLAAYVTALQEMHADGEIDIHALFPPPPPPMEQHATPAVVSRARGRPGGGDGIPSPVVDESFVMGAARASVQSRGMSTVAAAAVTTHAVATLHEQPMFADDSVLDRAEARMHASSLPPEMRIEGWVVRLDKSTGDAHVSRVKDMDVAFQAFKAALLLWHAAQSDLMLDGHVAPKRSVGA